MRESGLASTCCTPLSVSSLVLLSASLNVDCWRPLCPYGHSGRGRAARWVALWSLLAKQDEEDDLEVVKVILVRFVEQNADVPVPPVTAVVEISPEEHISERTQIVDIPVPPFLEELQVRILERVEQIVDVPVPLDRPGDQACRIPADTVHRQGCCRAYCDTATGPSVSDCGEGGGSPAHAAHRQNYGRASDHAGAVLQRHFPQIQTVVKTLKVLPVQFIGRVVEAPVVKQLIM